MSFSIIEQKRTPFGEGTPIDVLLKNMKGAGFP